MGNPQLAYESSCDTSLFETTVVVEFPNLSLFLWSVLHKIVKLNLSDFQALLLSFPIRAFQAQYP